MAQLFIRCVVANRVPRRNEREAQSAVSAFGPLQMRARNQRSTLSTAFSLWTVIA